MPTITNEAVIGSGYVTYRNARPQLLANDWIVAAVYNSSTSRLQFRVKKTPSGAWEDLAFFTVSALLSWSLAIKGTRVFTTFHTSSSPNTSLLNFEATTVSNASTLTASTIDSTSTSGQFNGEDLRINEEGTELHHAFSAKTSTYPNSFNIRYLKGTIATDGSVTWGAVEQLSSYNSTLQYQNPVVIVRNNTPSIICSFNNNTIEQRILFITKEYLTREFSSNMNTNWGNKFIYTLDGYTQFSPYSLFIPQSINGLANGRIWVAWHGKDATDSAKFNIRTSYSDDGGVTWSTHVKQTTGNVYDQTNPTLTFDYSGKVFLVWDSLEDRAGTPVTVTAYKAWLLNAMWGSRQTYSGDNYTGATALSNKDYTLRMSKPPVIRQYSGGVVFDGTYFAGAVVDPIPGPLGNKTSPTVLNYTVTPEEGSTVTSIVEKVNSTTVNTYSNPASLSRTFTIPLSNWDALAYWQTHTIAVEVTDSNQVTFTATYTFVKTLANDASVLEGTKAAKDGKDRISTKRDGIAGQVGLPPGSTFDAISAQLASGAFMKFFMGKATSSSTSPNTISASGLGFQPKIIIWFEDANTFLGVYVSPSYTKRLDNRFVANASLTTDNTSRFGASADAVITSDGFTVSTYITSRNLTYIALG